MPKFDDAVRSAGFSLNKLAAASGISRVTLARWRNGGYRPDMDTLVKVTTVIGVTLESVTATLVIPDALKRPPVKGHVHSTLRPLALMRYGLSCACCDESEYTFLTIDHIVPGRPESGPPNRLYQWLYANGYPGGFQTLCFNCNVAKGVKRQCPHRFREPMSDSARRARSLKVDTLYAYGRVCACCSEDGVEFLAIDHINGGGKEHRASLTGNPTSSGFYRILKQAGWPKDPPLRVLCHNCNHATSLGSCPHTW